MRRCHALHTSAVAVGAALSRARKFVDDGKSAIDPRARHRQAEALNRRRRGAAGKCVVVADAVCRELKISVLRTKPDQLYACHHLLLVDAEAHREQPNAATIVLRNNGLENRKCVRTSVLT
jgi:hypothetical protein